MKYIDSEKLIAEIDNSIAYCQINYSDDYALGFEQSLREIKNFIDFLQQEQPEGLHFTPLNRLIQKIPSEKWNDSTNNYAKKLRDCLIKEGYRKDAEVLQGYISYMNGNNIPMATMDEKEQPEVDLREETITNEFHIINNRCFNEGIVGWQKEKLIARHFWNKGYNARKED